MSSQGAALSYLTYLVPGTHACKNICYRILQFMTKINILHEMWKFISSNRPVFHYATNTYVYDAGLTINQYRDNFFYVSCVTLHGRNSSHLALSYYIGRSHCQTWDYLCNYNSQRDVALVRNDSRVNKKATKRSV